MDTSALRNTDIQASSEQGAGNSLRVPLQLVLDIYLGAESALDNESVYGRVAELADIDPEQTRKTVRVGKKSICNLFKRKVRWHQQTLKHLGLLEKAEGGTWRATSRDKAGHVSLADSVLLGFSTNLGLAVWGDCRRAFEGFNEPITAIITSPPYPLRKPRAYGNPTEQDYVDFISRCLEPIIKHLVPGGSLCVNLGNAIFLEGSPARSLYRERLILALCDRFGLHKMDEIIWHNPCRPPGPIRWASIERTQLNDTYEPVYWLCNDPKKVRSDNRRVLEPHTERHKRLMARGGEQREAVYGDGSHKIRKGSYGKQTEGRIPRNVLRISHRCAEQMRYKRAAESLGLPTHGAAMPQALAEWLIKFLTTEGEVVVDPFSGSMTTPRACEKLNRYWIAVELLGHYLRGGAESMKDSAGYWLNPAFTRLI